MLISLVNSNSLIVIVDECSQSRLTLMTSTKQELIGKSLKKLELLFGLRLSTNVHLFKDPNIYQAFVNVIPQFANETKLERIDVKLRLSKLKCYYLKT